MKIPSGLGDLDEISKMLKAIQPFETKINALGNVSIVQELHRKRALEYKNCTECLGKSAPGGECFSIDYLPTSETLTWDVPLAIQMANDGRASFMVPEDTLRLFMQLNSLPEPQHLDHVDPSVPGIMTVVPQQIAGSLYAPVLIDGTHRAARCLRDGLPFRVHFLNSDESFEVIHSAEHKLLATMRLMLEHGL